MRISLFLFAFLFSSAHAGAAEKDSRALFALWGKIKNPQKGESEPIGAYTAGCLAGARKLPVDGDGYAVMRLSRSRYYGHPSLVAYLKELGKSGKKAGLPLLLIGDMGRPRGGPMLTGHASHQTGLDVDIWFEMSRKKPSRKERENWGADPYVALAENKLSQAWGDKQRKLVELAASPEAVERVFVHPAIKRDLCERSPDAKWLPKVRAWWAHHDHLHARLRCPDGAEKCTKQDPVKTGDNGCGEELAWWFTDEAKEEGQKMAAKFKGREFPELPDACQQMVAHSRPAKKKNRKNASLAHQGKEP